MQVSRPLIRERAVRVRIEGRKKGIPLFTLFSPHFTDSAELGSMFAREDNQLVQPTK